MRIFLIIVAIAFFSVGCKNAGPPPEMAHSGSAEVSSNQSAPGQNPATLQLVEPAEGGITISELYSNSKKYSGKKVIIRGKVVKVNREIMERNWIHIQDGTEFEGNFDLTVTSLNDCNIGDIITIEGKISLDKDFGYGYSYDLLMEEGKITGQ